MPAHEQVRLTALAHCGGWAAKYGPGDLHDVLKRLPPIVDPRVLVGISTGDDAAVYQLTDKIALVQTLDFFAPIVDDPFTFGAIAVANSLSDVYAMGGKPLTALNIVGFPMAHPREILGEILLGGAKKAQEAGVVIVGGHTIDDAEPKYGLSVTGIVTPGKQLTNANAKPGDVLVLTKAIGTGIITTGIKDDKSEPSIARGAIDSMLLLNKDASEAAIEVEVNSCTDITGFGLLGHLRGMMLGSGTHARLEYSAIPFLPGAWDLTTEREVRPGGTDRNRSYYDPMIDWDRGVHEQAWKMLFDPQTSGGLLLSVPKERAGKLIRELATRKVQHAAIIGEVVAGKPGTIHVVP